MRAQLAALGLECWAKLTGGKGLHGVVPCTPTLAWEEVYELSREIASGLARAHPRLFTIAFDKRQRRGRVLLDYKRNHRAAVAVAAYSTRAHPGGTLSVPVSWDELSPRIGPDPYTVRNVLARLESLSVDPWAGYFRCRQRLAKKRARVIPKPRRIG